MGPPGLFMSTDTTERREIDLSPASLSLLALLGLPGREGGTARERLAEIMSPGCEPAKSASRLSSAICRLRAALSGHAGHVLKASSGNQALALRREVVVDIQAVADASEAVALDPSEAAIATLEAAVGSKAGEMLDGVKDHWAEEARNAIAEIYEQGLEHLIAAYREAGDVDHSISAARSLIRDDPYREDIHAVLLELYGRKGMRGHAALHYNDTRAVLNNELGIDPGQSLRSSLRAAMGGMRPDVPDIEALYDKLVEIDRDMRHLAKKVDRLIETRSDVSDVVVEHLE